MTYVAAACLVAGFAAGGSVSHLYHTRKAAVVETSALKTERRAASNERAKAAKYVARRQAAEAKHEVIREQVQEAIEVHRDWADERIPDGVRAQLEAASGGPGTSGFTRAMPAVPHEIHHDER